jgi:quinol monooxygenase YgiN
MAVDRLRSGVVCASMSRIDRDGDQRVGWLVRLRVRPGMIDQFRLLTEEMVLVAALEPGTLVYERLVTADRAFVYGYELYASSTAAISHLDTFQASFAGEFVQCVERLSFEVHRRPTNELRALLDLLGAVYLTPLITPTAHD